VKKKLAIISSHPIQYNAPFFRLLTERNNLALKVFYTLEKSAAEYDRDFGQKVSWDIPLLEGYDYSFVSNDGITEKGFFKVRNPGLEKEIENWGAQAVLVYGWNYWSHLRAMRYFKGRIPVCFRGDSTLIDDLPGFKSKLRRTFLKNVVYSNVDFGFYTGKNNRDYLNACGLKEDELVFAPHAVDNKRFAESASANRVKASQLRQGLGIQDNEVVFLFAGKFQSKKNPVFLAQAFSELKPGNAHLILAGDGVLKSHLTELTQHSSRIHLLPFQNQSSMPVLYECCDVFVLPSKGPGETWGLAINEAMACARPILASDKCGGAIDLVTNGKNGFIFQSGNAEDLKGKISLLANDRRLLAEMGKNSASVISQWSFENICVAIESTLLK
jgi:glycosyltransferase involved in cell wall biosynthesis